MSAPGPMSECPLCHVDYATRPALMRAVRVNRGVHQYVCQPCITSLTTDRPRACIVAVVEDDVGRILVGRREHRDWGHGKYVLIGGGIEGRETLTEAVEREVAEEAGIAVAAGTMLGVYRHLEGPTNNVVILYRARYVSGAPRAGSDLGAPGFFTLEELRALDMTPATRLFLRMAGHAVD